MCKKSEVSLILHNLSRTGRRCVKVVYLIIEGLLTYILIHLVSLCSHHHPTVPGYTIWKKWEILFKLDMLDWGFYTLIFSFCSLSQYAIFEIRYFYITSKICNISFVANISFPLSTKLSKKNWKHISRSISSTQIKS